MVNRDIGFSLWLDFIERDYLDNKFEKLISDGIINGATSNPSIFADSITTSKAYKEQLSSLNHKSPKEKYEALAIRDIKTASQKLRVCYDDNNDGYISIEVDPFLSNNTEGTIEEAKRLFNEISEPNVMIKIPATNAGYEAMTTLISIGISVNATLIFSPNQAQKCINAMNKGFSIVDENKKVDCVISVFVSRFDRFLNRTEVGIMNASKIYNLIEKNANKNIKTLFASTGVKGDNLEKDYYITKLFASNSVNTAPLSTIEAYVESLKYKSPHQELPISEDNITTFFKELEDSGVNMENVYKKLLKDGLEAFENAFTDMLNNL